MTRTAIECRPPLRLVTMPLYSADDRKNAFLCGTGVLLQVLDKHFIITVAHVFDDIPDGDKPLMVTDAVSGHTLYGLGEVTLRRSRTNEPHTRSDDPFDICVCEITTDLADTIRSAGNFRFIGLNEVDPWDRQHPHSWYMVFGFPEVFKPSDDVAKTVSSNACAYASFVYVGERGPTALRYFEPDVGILLDYSPSTTRSDIGVIEAPPRPHGMSGAGIWRMAEADIETDNWSVADMKLVAIQNSIDDPRTLLAGTRLRHALEMIYRNHHELQPEFERHFGPDQCRQYLS